MLGLEATLSACSGVARRFTGYIPGKWPLRFIRRYCINIHIRDYELHAVCVSANTPPPSHLLNASTNVYETLYVRVYHCTRAHLNGVLHKSLPSFCVSVCISLLSLLGKGSVKCIPPFIARQRLGKYDPAERNTANTKRIVGRLCLCIPLSLLGNNSVKIFQQQQRIAGGVVFYAVRVVSNEGRRLIFFQNFLLM
jgi:hypothetical protein